MDVSTYSNPTKIIEQDASFFSGLLTIISSVIIFIIIVSFVVGLIMLISNWKIYKKAGQPGWKSIIPFYNMYVLIVDIIKKPIWWFLLMFVPMANIVIAIMMQIELAKKFNKDTGFIVLMILLPIIAYPILAFGKDQYENNGNNQDFLNTPQASSNNANSTTQTQSNPTINSQPITNTSAQPMPPVQPQTINPAQPSQATINQVIQPNNPQTINNNQASAPSTTQNSSMPQSNLQTPPIPQPSTPQPTVNVQNPQPQSQSQSQISNPTSTPPPNPTSAQPNSINNQNPPNGPVA